MHDILLASAVSYGHLGRIMVFTGALMAAATSSAVAQSESGQTTFARNPETEMLERMAETSAGGQPIGEAAYQDDCSPQTAVPSDALQQMMTRWMDPESFPSTLKTIAAITVLSLAPAILLMTTSFIRISIVLGLLRQALGTQLLPSNQIMTSLAMFLTVLIMAPVWMRVYQEAIVPYTESQSQMSAVSACQIGIQPVREFMGRQIEKAGNSDDVWLFYDYLANSGTEPQSYAEVPLPALLPAFVLSELKVAFLIGFQVFLPFLIIDLVVASVSTSLGIMMLPPTMISLPLKLMMFVLVDGWHLVVGMLLESFGGML